MKKCLILFILIGLAFTITGCTIPIISTNDQITEQEYFKEKTDK